MFCLLKLVNWVLIAFMDALQTTDVVASISVMSLSPLAVVSMAKNVEILGRTIQIVGDAEQSVKIGLPTRSANMGSSGVVKNAVNVYGCEPSVDAPLIAGVGVGQAEVGPATARVT